MGLRRFRFPLPQQSSLEHHHVQHPSHLIIKKLGIQHIRHQRIYKVESASPILGARNIKISNHDRSEAEKQRTWGTPLPIWRQWSTIRLLGLEWELDLATDGYFRREDGEMESHKSRKVGLFFKNLEPQCFSAITFRNRVFTGPDGREYF